MGAVFYIKRGDTAPIMRATLNPAPNLTGASVLFITRDAAGAIKTNRAATIVGDPTLGTVEYAWQASDTDLVGEFQGEFQVTYAGGAIETYPNFGYITIVVSDDVN